MKLMETAPSVLINEADVSQLKSFVDKVITELKKQIDDGGDSATSAVETYVDVVPQELLDYDDPLWDELIAAGWPKTPSKEFKFLNAAFKEKYGDGFYRYAEKVEDAAMLADEKSIKRADKAIYKLLSQKLTVKATPKWLAANFEFYTSGQKVVVVERDGTGFPEAVFGKPSFTFLSMTRDEFVHWLLEQGVPQGKRPKRSKPTPPMYD